MTSPSFAIRDLLYLDFEKAASIWSQLEGGLLERISITEDTGRDEKAGTRFGIPKLAEATLGVDYVQKRSTLHSKTLHHDVLSLVDERLCAAGLVADLSTSVDPDESSPEKIRASISGRPYLKAEGWSVVEDYRRILTISEKFNQLVEFLAKAGLEAVKQSPDYQQLQQALASARDEAGRISDRNKRAVVKEKMNAIERTLEALAKPKISSLQGWLLDGIRLWITTFMPARINFRIYPFPRCPSFQVLCNLKRDCFVDQDLEHLLYGYGSRPNVPLATFGLVTSVPPESAHPFNPMAEFESAAPVTDQIAFEKAFRGMFGAIDEIEAFMRYSRYPNVTVHPIAVYRSFSAIGTEAG